MNFDKAFEGYNVPQSIRQASINICNRFVINGICDPMYIANSVAVKCGIGDGKGNFTGTIISNAKTIAEDLQGSYGCNISKSEIAELQSILENGIVNFALAQTGLKKRIAMLKQENKTCDGWRIDYNNGQIECAEKMLEEYSAWAAKRQKVGRNEQTRKRKSTCKYYK